MHQHFYGLVNMIDESIFFKVNSETDERKLIELNNVIVRRVNNLRRRRSGIQKAEIITENKEESK